jgi:hypothetical protein
MFAASLLEAGEGVPTLSPDLVAGPGADLAFFDHVPQVVLTAVVVERQVGAFQHSQQPGLVTLEALQHAVKGFAGGFGGAQSFKAGGDLGFGHRVGMLTVGLQVLIEKPDLLLHPGGGLPVRVVQGQQVLQRPLGMHPAQAVHEEVELPGIVADQAHVQVKALRSQAANQRPFGSQRHRPGAVDEVALQISRPVLGVSQYHLGARPAPHGDRPPSPAPPCTPALRH